MSGYRDKCSVSSISSSIAESETQKPRTVRLCRNEDGYGFYLKKIKVRMSAAVRDLNAAIHLLVIFAIMF